MMTDPVADMLTRIRNAIEARHGQVEVPLSNLKLHIAEVLRDEGYIVGLEVHGTAPKQMLRIELKYLGKREPVLTGLRRVSRPGDGCTPRPPRSRASSAGSGRPSSPRRKAC